MYIHDLKNAEGEKQSKKRLGRGIGSGIGKTSGKGHKGQNARSGGGVRPGFEGGQNPLYRRLPIKGFSNAKFKKVYSVVNVSSLNIFEANTRVDAEKLLESGILSKIEKDGIKILGNGELTVALTVVANKFTAQAKEKITAQGGAIEEV
ncbi:MAG: 50S ribosomal protein L15 [Clostridia bacterium]|nr:50S ribosomal protein L15 [Clostridia bacterium]